jgi:hypothetical protein
VANAAPTRKATRPLMLVDQRDAMPGSAPVPAVDEPRPARWNCKFWTPARDVVQFFSRRRRLDREPAQTLAPPRDYLGQRLHISRLCGRTKPASWWDAACCCAEDEPWRAQLGRTLTKTGAKQETTRMPTRMDMLVPDLKLICSSLKSNWGNTMSGWFGHVIAVSLDLCRTWYPILISGRDWKTGERIWGRKMNCRRCTTRGKGEGAELAAFVVVDHVQPPRRVAHGVGTVRADLSSHGTASSFQISDGKMRLQHAHPRLQQPWPGKHWRCMNNLMAWPTAIHS